MKKLILSFISLFFIANSCNANSALEDAIDKAVYHLRLYLKSGNLLLPPEARTALVAIKKGERHDEEAERKAISTQGGDYILCLDLNLSDQDVKYLLTT